MSEPTVGEALVAKWLENYRGLPGQMARDIDAAIAGAENRVVGLIGAIDGEIGEDVRGLIDRANAGGRR